MKLTEGVWSCALMLMDENRMDTACMLARRRVGFEEKDSKQSPRRDWPGRRPAHMLLASSSYLQCALASWFFVIIKKTAHSMS